jgi:hypothetical protein
VLRSVIECICSGAIALLIPAIICAQSAARVVPVPDEVACAACNIRTTVAAILVVPRDSTDGFPIAVRSDPRSRFWVFRRGDMPVIFDQSGNFLQTLGRTGRGPGEYVQPYDMANVGHDSILVFDGDGRRVSVLDTSLRYIRSVTMPFEMHSPVVISWPDTVLASGILPTPGQAGWPLHHVSFQSRQPTAVASFGLTDGEIRPDGVARTWHWFTPSAAGKVWAAWMYGYNLSEWDSRGRVIRALERKPRWFSASSPSSLGTPTTPPPPFVAGIQQDRDGLLWVLVHTPAPTWREAWPKLSPGTREVSSRMIAKERMYSTIIEVIDPRIARVMARQTLNSFGVPGLAGGRIAVYDVDPDGNGRITVLSISLAGR